MKPGELLDAINELSQERGLDQESIIEAIEDAIVGAAYRKYKNYRNIEATFNQETGEIDLMHYKVVVEEVADIDNEISLDEVAKLDPLAEPGDEVEYEIDALEFSNVIAQTARQLIFQKIREAEREAVAQKYIEQKGEIIHGKVSRIERGGRVIISMGNSEAALEPREQIAFEKLQPGEHVRVLLLDLSTESRGPQLIVSRTHPEFLIKLVEAEVPEVYDGIIEVVAAAREPGRRAKVAVFTNDSDVDPVGACVGMRGSRVQAIVSELCGERIDVIEWTEELEDFITNALAPAEIIEIDLNIEKSSADIKIASDQLSLAIGKQGQNVRLASKLTGIMINVRAWDPTIEDRIGEPDPSEDEEPQKTNEESSTAGDEPSEETDGVKKPADEADTDQPVAEAAVEEEKADTDQPVAEVAVEEEKADTDQPVAEVAVEEEKADTDQPIAEVAVEEEKADTDQPVAEVAVEEEKADTDQPIAVEEEKAEEAASADDAVNSQETEKAPTPEESAPLPEEPQDKTETT